MNSVLQCLSNTRPLLEWCLSEDYMLDINTTSSSMKGCLIKGEFSNNDDNNTTKGDLCSAFNSAKHFVVTLHV